MNVRRVKRKIKLISRRGECRASSFDLEIGDCEKDFEQPDTACHDGGDATFADCSRGCIPNFSAKRAITTLFVFVVAAVGIFRIFTSDGLRKRMHPMGKEKRKDMRRGEEHLGRKNRHSRDPMHLKKATPKTSPTPEDKDSVSEETNELIIHEVLRNNTTGEVFYNFGLGFMGADCASEGLIDKTHFIEYCGEDPAKYTDPYNCARIMNTNTTQCGWFEGGRFAIPRTSANDVDEPTAQPVYSFERPSPVLGQEGLFHMTEQTLEKLYKLLIAQMRINATNNLAPGNNDCLGPSVFGSYVSFSEGINFTGAGPTASLQSTECPFKYLPFGAPIASVLHHHAVGKLARNHTYGARRGLVFFGDSMMRQVFLHIIASIRGLDHPTEFHFHSNAAYFVFADRDELVVFDGDPPEGYRPLLKHWYPGLDKGIWTCNASATDSAGFSPLFVLLYVFDSLIKVDTHFDFTHLSLAVGGHHYWDWTPSDQHAFQKRMARHLHKNKGQRLIVVNIPWRFNDAESERAKKNTLTYEWLSSFRNDEDMNESALGDAASLPSAPSLAATQKLQDVTFNGIKRKRRQAWLIDFCAFADANRHFNAGIEKVTEDNTHYQCAWTTALYPGPATKSKVNTNNCRDPMNEAVMQWLLQLLLRL